MKKIIYSFLVFVICFLAYSSVVKAETYTGPDGNQYEYMYLCDTTTSFGYKMKVYSHYPFGLCSWSPYGESYRLCTVAKINDIEYCGDLTVDANSYQVKIDPRYPSGSISTYGYVVASKEDGTLPSYTGVIREPYQNSQLVIYESFEDALEGLTYVEKTSYFDASIPKADFSVFVNGFPSWTTIDEETSFLSYNH